MIQHLSIKNYTLIKDVEVDFNEGLTVITGETGAGKSILLGALSLLLGKRADLSQIRGKEKKCIIEGVFSVAPYQLKELFAENDLDYEEPTILRREILPSGKSRAFINDSPVTLQQMQSLGGKLVDIHSQFDTQHLASESYQMEMVDVLAGNETLLAAYRAQLRTFHTLKKDLEDLRQQQEEARKEEDYVQFLYEELEAAKLVEIQQQDLEDEFEKLNNVEVIKTTLEEAVQVLSYEGTGSNDTLVQARNALQKIKSFGNAFNSLWERLNSLVLELEDLLQELDAVSDTVEMDPEKLSLLQERLEELYRLQKKHSVTTVEELLSIQSELEGKLQFGTNLELDIQKKEKEVSEIQKEPVSKAEALREHRLQTFPSLKANLENYLDELGLPYAQFQFQLTPQDTFRDTGRDALEMLFSANKGMAPGLVHKMASGGEMSRIMLSIKAILATYKNLPTIIFDEIDTGVSGEIAYKMATIMGTMSEKVQLISITHLPQIAAKGNYHKKVFKINTDTATFTDIKDLVGDERINEIAQMIGGSSVGESAIAHAKQLLN